MSKVWTDANGFLRQLDHRGWCWRWDAYQNDKQGGWVRDAKYDAPDSARGGKCG